MAKTRTYIRMEVSRNVWDELSLVSGSDYDMPFKWKVYKVEEQTNPFGGVWQTRTFSQSNDVLTIFSLTNPPSKLYSVIIYFYIFITDKIAAYEQDSITSGSVVEWEPWLLNTPKITSSIKDVLEGQLNVSASSFTFINDKSLLSLIDEKTSFYNKQIIIWVNFGLGSGIESYFKGRITNLDVAVDKFGVSIKNVLHLLNNLPTMGARDNEQYNRSSTSFDEALPIPFIWGNVTPHYPIYGSGSNKPVGKTPTVYKKENSIKLLHAGGTVGGAITYYAMRAPDFDLTPNIPFTIVSGGTAGTTTATIQISSDSDMRNVLCGFYQGEVWTGASWQPVDVEILNLTTRNVKVDLAVAGTFAGTITQFKMISGVFIFTDHPDYDPGGAYFDGRTITTINPTGPGAVHKILTVQPFGKAIAGNSGSVFLDPTKHDVYAIITNNKSYKHGTVIQQIAEAQGLSVNSSSISAANTTLATNVFMSLPDLRAKDYPTALDAIGNVMRSTGGFIYINDDEELVYEILGTSSTSHTVRDIDIIDGSLKIAYDYRDVTTQIRTKSQNKYDLVAGTRDEYINNGNEKRLHDVDKTYEYMTVLEDNGTVPQTKLNYISRPRTKFSMQLPTTFKDMAIGEFVDLESSQLEGMNLDNLMITVVVKTTLYIEITLTKIEIT